MTRKIIEIKVTKRGQDGMGQVTFINALDDLQGTVLSQYDDALEAGIERVIYQKAEQSDEMESDGIYEVSPTFHDPTVVLVGLGDDITATATVKPRGIRRPFVKELITPATKKLYHHESGIIGLMEEKDRNLHRIVRLPVRLVRELGMEAFTEFYPELEDCLEFQPPEREGISATIDGDLYYKETIMVDFTKDIKEIERQMGTKSEAFGKGVMEVGSLARREYKRSKNEMEDFATAGDVRRFYEELEHTPWDVCITVVPYPRVLISQGLMARIYSDIQTESEGRQVFEMRIPVDLIREIKQRGKKTRIEAVDRFLQNERMDIGETGFGKEIIGVSPVQLVGDMVYSRVCHGEQDYNSLKMEIDDLGKKYLDKRMKYLRVVG